VGLERDTLSVVSTIEKLLGRNSSGSGLENREYGRSDPMSVLGDTLYPQKLALISPTCSCRSVGTVRSGTKATEFVCLINLRTQISILASYNGFPSLVDQSPS
jgi:hypothetical protein